jgi:hypothetical protein
MMFLDMRGHDAIERLGRWIAERGSGELRLITGDTEVTIQVVDGKAVAIRGLDPADVAQRLEVEPAGHDELLAEAVAVAEASELSQGQAIATAKEILQEAIATWYGDGSRQLDLVDADAAGPVGPNISLSHVIVQVVLSDESGRLCEAILTNDDALLRRSDRFLELYSPLRLSEEADLIVAKVTGQRSVREVSAQSPDGTGEVRSLLAALVATGILEEASAAEIDLQLEPEPRPEPMLVRPDHRRRRLPIWVLVAALAALLLIVIAVAVVWPRPDAAVEVPSADGLTWAIVVDMGCEPQDLQRVLKKTQEHPETLEAVSAGTGEGSPCWRLVWGRFATIDAARQAISEVPQHLIADGFTPHAIELQPDQDRFDTASGNED